MQPSARGFDIDDGIGDGRDNRCSGNVEESVLEKSLDEN